MPANDIYSVLDRLGRWSREPAAVAPRPIPMRSQRELVRASLLCKPGS
jgi:hypothetical protein